jgi:hypothetical protein
VQEGLAVWILGPEGLSLGPLLQAPWHSYFHPRGPALVHFPPVTCLSSCAAPSMPFLAPILTAHEASLFWSLNQN